MEWNTNSIYQNVIKIKWNEKVKLKSHCLFCFPHMPMITMKGFHNWLLMSGSPVKPFWLLRIKLNLSYDDNRHGISICIDQLRPPCSVKVYHILLMVFTRTNDALRLLSKSSNQIAWAMCQTSTSTQQSTHEWTKLKFHSYFESSTQTFVVDLIL